MHTEVPVCKRCCFCLPLRYGLITWGYVRLAISMLLLVGFSISFHGMLSNKNRAFIFYTVTLGFLLVLTLTDIVLNIIIGGHEKNLKLLRAYYIYSCVLFVLMALMTISSSISTLLMFKLGEIDLKFHIWIILVDIATLLAQLLIQIYVVVLVRSEIMKLRSNGKFRFVNNAAEAECTMKCGEETERGKRTNNSYEQSMDLF